MGKGFYALVRVTDLAPYITRLILPVEKDVTDVPDDAFDVYAERYDKDGTILMLPTGNPFAPGPKTYAPSKGNLKVRKAYPSDSQGNAARSGRFITLELAYGPAYPLSSKMAVPRVFNEIIYHSITVKQQKLISCADETTLNYLTYDKLLEERWPDSKDFLTGESFHAGYPIRYGYFIPQGPGAKKPLLIWLHGAGAGGKDPRITYVGKKLTALATPKIQSCFGEGGCYILTPQIETYWLDDGTKNGGMSDSGQSLYGQTLMDLIKEFLEKNPGIDRDRIYLAGDSNGGFMTMRMIMDYPDFFAAANPNCEAMLDRHISDEDIANLKDLPIWFCHAKNDPVVLPSLYVVPTYERLIAAGAKNVHFTFWDNITDLHQTYEEIGGKPHEYLGHFVWVPVLNDDCRLDYDGKPVYADGEPVSLFRWLGKQHRQLQK